MNNKTLSIIGLGWLGYELAMELKSDFHVLGTCRTPSKAMNLTTNGFEVEVLNQECSPSEKLLSSDVIVLNIPPFKNQLEWFQSWNWKPMSHLIFMSSISVYGQRTSLDELTPPQPQSENGKILVEEELWIQHTFPNCTIIRLGGLIGKDRHPGNTLSGKKGLKDGNAPVNLIHLDDVIGFTQEVITKKVLGVYNLVHPDHPTKRDFYSDYCRRKQLPEPIFEDGLGPHRIISSKKVETFYKFRKNLMPKDS